MYIADVRIKIHEIHFHSWKQINISCPHCNGETVPVTMTLDEWVTVRCSNCHNEITVEFVIIREHEWDN